MASAGVWRLEVVNRSRSAWKVGFAGIGCRPATVDARKEVYRWDWGGAWSGAGLVPADG